MNNLDKETMIKSIVNYVKKHEAISNRECRELLDIPYNHVIKLFGEMTQSGILTRVGKGPGTKYFLNKEKQ